MKRIDALRDLSDDHHTALVLARRCRQAARREASRSAEPTWRRVREAFAGHLEPHFRIEERHLLPALEALGEPGLAQRIREDHASLRALAEAPTADARRLGEFGKLLEAHVRFEEREVFETTQHRLPADARRGLAEACRDTPRVCPALS